MNETRLKVNDDTARSPNLTGKFDAEELSQIGATVVDGYERDLASRHAWERRNQAGMDLALQMQKDKNFPWAGSSNIAFPLITIATLQWHSQAYPQLVRTPHIVRSRVSAPDPTGELTLQAERISDHMSWQILEEDEAWEEQHDRLLINLPIVGTAFKKVYFDGGLGHNVAELVLAQDLILDYYAKSVETCSRITERIPLTRNDIYEKIGLGVFRDVSEEAWFEGAARPHREEDYRRDQRMGLTPQASSDMLTPFMTLEQHSLWDFDGDGYMEPYIVTVDLASQQVLRIVANWEGERQVQRDAKGKVLRIERTQYYQKYSFIPSPDNGIYDLGWGVLLGPLNESVNTLVNQLVDAGTMSNTAGGFLGRGAKIRGGQYSFAPLEWKRVDSTGDDLRKNIFPLPVREPSNVLFQLLNLLVNYTQRISGSTDTIAGENPGQNTPASTTQTMVQQGMKIYNAIYKRVWRAMRGEFRKLYLLNAAHLPEFGALWGSSGGKPITRKDYSGNPSWIAPEADPHIASNQQNQARAMFLKEQSMGTPGYDRVAVEKAVLRAFEVEGAEVLFPGPDKVPPLPNPKAQIEELKLKGKQMEIQFQQEKFMLELREERAKNQAQILLWEAQAAKFMEEAGGVKEGHEIAAFEAAIGAAKLHNDTISRHIDMMLKTMGTDNGQNRGMGGMAGASNNAGSPAVSAGTPGGT